QTTNTKNESEEWVPTLAGLVDGGWIATYEGSDADGYGVYQQRFSADGKKFGVETLVNDEQMGFQSFSMVTALPDGGWVVTWEAENILAGAVVDPADIYLQRYTKDGEKTGPTAALVNNGQGGQDG